MKPRSYVVYAWTVCTAKKRVEAYVATRLRVTCQISAYTTAVTVKKSMNRTIRYPAGARPNRREQNVRNKALAKRPIDAEMIQRNELPEEVGYRLRTMDKNIDRVCLEEMRHIPKKNDELGNSDESEKSESLPRRLVQGYGRAGAQRLVLR